MQTLFTIDVKRGLDSTWLARFSDWQDTRDLWGGESFDGWLPTPFFGPATFEQVRDRLLECNPGATVREVQA